MVDVRGCIEEFLNEVKFLLLEHRRSSLLIISVQETLRKYNRMIVESEGLTKVTSHVPAEYFRHKGWCEAIALKVNEDYCREITKLRQYVHDTRLILERLILERTILYFPSSVHRSQPEIPDDVNTNLELQLQKLALSTPVHSSSGGDEIDMKTVGSIETEEEVSSYEGCEDFLLVLMRRVVQMLYEDWLMKETIVNTLLHPITDQLMEVYVMNWTLRSSIDQEVWSTTLRELETRLV